MSVQRHITYGGVEVQFHAFLTSILDGDERSDSESHRYKLGKTDMDVVAKRKTIVPAGNRTPVVQPVAGHYADWSTTVKQSLSNYTKRIK
jgi:hypothetical protein